MQKLFIITFLNFLCSCGPNITSGPDAIVVGPTLVSEKDSVEKPTLLSPEISIISVFDIETDKNISATDPLQISDRYFFEEYRDQHMEQSFSIQSFDAADSFYYPVEIGSTYLVRMLLKNYRDIETMTLRIYDPQNEDSFEIIRLGSNELQHELIEFEIDLTSLPDLSLFAIKVEDYDYTVNNTNFNHLHVLKELNRTHYKLVIENSNKRVKGLISTELNLKQALAQMKIKHIYNDFGKLTHMLGQSSSSKKVDIWNYPDHVGFWELFNTPSQSLNYYPLGGETIVIKWVTVKDIRQNVYRKEIETINLNSNYIPVDWKGAVRVEIYDLALSLETPYQLIDSKGANETYYISRSSRERDWEEKKKGRCSIQKFSVGWEKQNLERPFSQILGHAVSNGENHIVLKDNATSRIDFDLNFISKNLKEGFKNINCKSYSKVSAGGSVSFGLRSKSHSPRLQGSAKVIRYFSY